MGSDYMDTTPARPPPPGHSSNFVNPESRSYQLVIVIAVAFALVVLITTTRVYIRLKVTRSFGVDDCKSISTPYLVCDLLTLSRVLYLSGGETHLSWPKVCGEGKIRCK